MIRYDPTLVDLTSNFCSMYRREMLFIFKVVELSKNILKERLIPQNIHHFVVYLNSKRID